MDATQVATEVQSQPFAVERVARNPQRNRQRKTRRRSHGRLDANHQTSRRTLQRRKKQTRMATPVQHLRTTPKPVHRQLAMRTTRAVQEM